jgi:hypothetical protein
MRKLIILILVILPLGSAAEKTNLVLTDDSIGSMAIEPEMEISLFKIMRHFQSYKVSHEIRSGDSPDYHSFVVSTYQGEALVSFISYIEKDSEYENGVVKLDEVLVHSSIVQDQYGISIGSTINAALKEREELKFGAGHMDNYMGNGKIWYLFYVKGKHGTQVTKEEAVAENPKIDAISWPYPRWR